MKTIKLLIAMLFALASVQSTNAQRTIATKTENIKVYGECEMCKKRIEKAALTIVGVQSAIWDEHTKTLTLKYNQLNKAVADSVQKKIASAGHDTELYTATDETYNSLPECCHYARKPVKQ